MARNAHPEVTRARILDAAQELFAEQGYERTSIQNIVDRLGDLSKGAIYHHFASKEAILEALGERDGNEQMSANQEIMARDDLNALDKLREILRHSMSDVTHLQITRSSMPMLDDPATFAANMRFWSQELPRLWLPLFEEGIEDGSIPTEYPREAAQLLALLPNYWMPSAFSAEPATKRDMMRRVRCLSTMLDAIGVPLFDEALIELTVNSMTFLGSERKE